MTPSQRNHLRLLLGWVRCEIGQTPEEFKATVASIAPAFTDLSIDGQARIVNHYDAAKSVPQYVRNAVKQLYPLVVADGDTVNGHYRGQRALEQKEARK